MSHHPFGKTYPAGYAVKISSWENDGDHSEQTFLFGLSKEKVNFYQAFLEHFDCHHSSSRLGNEDYNPYTAFSVIERLYDSHQEAIQEEFKDFDMNLIIDEERLDGIDTTAEIHADFFDSLYQLITDLLGDPVDYDPPFVRVFDGIEVYYLPNEIKIPPLKKVKV